MRDVAEGEIYRHYKGHVYQVLGTACHSEDPAQEFVIYKEIVRKEGNGSGYIYGKMWARPKKMFLESIEKDGKIINRFEKIETEVQNKNNT